VTRHSAAKSAASLQEPFTSVSAQHLPSSSSQIPAHWTCWQRLQKKLRAKKISMMPYISEQKKSPRSNPRKKFQANKNLINAAIYFCEFLELIRIRNVSKQRQTIFLPNARSNQQKKLRTKKISMMPYISEQKKSPRSNPRKKFQANKNLINAAIYFCEFLELIRIRNVNKQRQTIFLPNARSD
jgi:transposase